MKVANKARDIFASQKLLIGPGAPGFAAREVGEDGDEWEILGFHRPLTLHRSNDGTERLRFPSRLEFAQGRPACLMTSRTPSVETALSQRDKHRCFEARDNPWIISQAST